MAEREEVFDVSIPAKTTRAAPVSINVSFPPGYVVGLEIVIPPGPAGLSGIALAQAHQRVLPRTLGAFFVGDDEVIRRELEGYLNTGSWEVVGFNEDVNAHGFEVRFQLMEVTKTQPAVGTAEPLQISPGGEIATGPTGTTGEGISEPPPQGPPVSEPSEQPTTPEPPVEPPATPPPAEAPPEAAPPGEAPAAEEAPPAPASPEAPAVEEAPPPAVEPEGPAAQLVEEGEKGTVPAGTKTGPKKHPAPKHTHKKTPTRRVTRSETLPAGGWLPHGARFDLRRTDQGQDFITAWRGPVIAPAPGTVVGVHADRPYPNGFGPHYAVVHIDSGPFGGKDWYIGHCTSAVGVGHHFKTGDVLAHADQGHVEGGGWVELGEAPGGLPGPMGAGARIAHLFGAVTRKHTTTVKAAPKKKAGKHPAKKAPGKHKSSIKKKPAAKKRAPAHKAPKPARQKRVKPPRAPRPKRAPRPPRAPRPKRAPAAHHAAHKKAHHP